ncbi:MAG: zinc-binding alcohol dehydrogenase family protein [Bdellovibrionales bacterium CG10_big_fil_rev_8_21_14_0_10_45_34]|nr:MAG: zinc-binding alcohol dehydrogenase family protein [Bdellovibrionales bacterium CG10_big_fil_rev_8_21_14_0_10_45_34]
MLAIGFRKNLSIEETDALIEARLPRPAANGFDVEVRISAVSLNPVDTKQRKGREITNETLQIPVWDAVGIISKIGDQVDHLKVGDRVFYSGDLNRPGAASEYHVVDSRLVALAPKSISDAEAAALPLTSLTAYEGLFEQLRVIPGKTILVVGGAGGVGSMVIQLAKLAGLNVIATASRDETILWVKSFGANSVIDHRERLSEGLKKIGVDNVDYIFNAADTATYWSQMEEVIRPFGRIVSIVESSIPLDLTIMMKKSVTFSWELMFTRSLFQTEDMQEQSRILSKIASLVDEGKIRSTIFRSMSPINSENMKEAHRLLESGKSIGKIVISEW